MRTPEFKVLRFVGALYRSINSKADSKYKQFNLQKGQYMFITRVCENPGINFMDLSNMLKVDKRKYRRILARHKIKSKF